MLSGLIVETTAEWMPAEQRFLLSTPVRLWRRRRCLPTVMAACMHAGTYVMYACMQSSYECERDVRLHVCTCVSFGFAHVCVSSERTHMGGVYVRCAGLRVAANARGLPRACVQCTVIVDANRYMRRIVQGGSPVLTYVI